MTTFELNGETFDIIEVTAQAINVPNGYVVYKREKKNIISKPEFVALNPSELHSKLKRFFLKKVFKPYLKL